MCTHRGLTRKNELWDEDVDLTALISHATLQPDKVERLRLD